MTRGEIILLVVFALVAYRVEAMPDPYTEIRYAGTPVRDVDGKIKRDAKVLREFQKAHPCPSTGKKSGACPGWAKDHVISLDCGGADAVWNMQWLPYDTKHTVGAHAKDSFERKIYAANPPFPDTAHCVNIIVK